MYNLLVVAHPDDETIFFTGLLLNKTDLPWKVVCVTWNKMVTRRKYFKQACAKLNVEPIHWNFLDDFKVRLPIDAVAAELAKLPTPAAVFTHSSRGDYGHPHHQDVFHAVHRTFKDVHSLAYSSPELSFELTKAQMSLRSEIMKSIYRIDPSGFLRLPPSMNSDDFAKITYDPLFEYPLWPRAC